MLIPTMDMPEHKTRAYFILFIVKFLCNTEAEADTVDEAGLLVKATESTGGVNGLIFFLEGFCRSLSDKARLMLA